MPFSTARDRPDTGTVRDKYNSPSSSTAPASRASCATPPRSSTANTPCAHASEAPGDTRPLLAGPPEISRMALNSMDLPAPVSPVIAVIPPAGVSRAR